MVSLSYFVILLVPLGLFFGEIFEKLLKDIKDRMNDKLLYCLNLLRNALEWYGPSFCGGAYLYFTIFLYQCLYCESLLGVVYCDVK